jgi:hypothetical protein
MLELLPRAPPLACLALLLAHHLASAQLAPPSPPAGDSPRSPLLLLNLVLILIAVVYLVVSLSFLVLGEGHRHNTRRPCCRPHGRAA